MLVDCVADAHRHAITHAGDIRLVRLDDVHGALVAGSGDTGVLLALEELGKISRQLKRRKVLLTVVLVVRVSLFGQRETQYSDTAVFVKQRIR